LRLFEFGLDDGLDMARRKKHRARGEWFSKSARSAVYGVVRGRSRLQIGMSQRVGVLLRLSVLIKGSRRHVHQE